MHGRVKTRTTEEQKEIARQEKCKKAKVYKDTMKIILEKRSSSIYDKEALNLTASLLTSNPDIISLWNYRREIFLNSKCEEDLESYQKLLEKDLSLTEQCLRVNPKSYGSWHHRIWILNNLPHPDWEKELKLCTKYLQLDERNFHCWDYRRIVTESSNVPEESEYKYTLEKIESNFSNYSAWHLRSKLLPKIFPDPEGRFPIDETKHREELELVESAAFTDPNDQSAWFYLRWLLGLTEPKISLVCAESRQDEIFLVTSRSIRFAEGSQFGVKLKINDELIRVIWRSERTPSCLWSCKLESKIQPTDSIQVLLEENGVEHCTLQLQGNTSVNSQPNFCPAFSENLKETLSNQFSSCEQLLELEPDNKWTLLTSVFLMLSIDYFKHKAQIVQGLDKLSVIDPFRSGYYHDLRSKIIAQLAIMYNFNKTKKICLSNQNLTALYHSHYLHDFEEIDLSQNYLSSDILPQLYTLVNCRVLNLSGNKIRLVSGFPELPELETLLLDDNMIEEIDRGWVRRFPRLKNLSLLNNPVTEKRNLRTKCHKQFMSTASPLLFFLATGASKKNAIDGSFESCLRLTAIFLKNFDLLNEYRSNSNLSLAFVLTIMQA